MGFDSAFNSFNISAAGLSAERLRMEVVSNNIANAAVTRTPEGGPYRRKELIFETAYSRHGFDPCGPDAASGLGGVNVVGIVEDQSEFPREFNPSHPDADFNGFVAKSNVNLPLEMVNLITASRAYEANLKAAQSFVSMSQQALAVLKGNS